MVSFQCHACGDVVKKPKLDQHRGRCNRGFDCIDCSTTFNTPADYKGHTQCISEAEKYQKSMYKGPKTNHTAPKNNYTPQPQAPPGGAWRGGRGGGSWGRPSFRATGANDTPLGTPTRNSPEPRPSLRTHGWKNAQYPTPTTVSLSANENKRKLTSDHESVSHIDAEEPASKKAKVAAEADVVSIPSKESVNGSDEGKKKERKEKREKREKASAVDESAEKTKSSKHKDAKEHVEVDKQDKKSKKDKKRKAKEDQTTADSVLEVNGKLKKSKEEAADNGDVVQEQEEGKKKKKDKQGVEMEDDSLLEAPKEKKSKKEKKDKREKNRSEEVIG